MQIENQVPQRKLQYWLSSFYNSHSLFNQLQVDIHICYFHQVASGALFISPDNPFCNPGISFLSLFFFFPTVTPLEH